jgi:hypothetical protein
MPNPTGQMSSEVGPRLRNVTMLVKSAAAALSIWGTVSVTVSVRSDALCGDRSLWMRGPLLYGMCLALIRISVGGGVVGAE